MMMKCQRSPPNPVRWTYPLNVVVLVPSLNVLNYNDLSALKVSPLSPQVRRPYPSLASGSCLSVLFCRILLFVCRLGLCPFIELVCDLLLR